MQEQLDDFQDSIVLFPPGFLDDEQLFHVFSRTNDTVTMTVSRRVAQRINTVVTQKLFGDQHPLTKVSCAAVAAGPDILPYRGMRIIITENGDKESRIVNGQDATIIIQFSDGQRTFLYPVTHPVEGQGDVLRYPFTPAYARTICKSQGQNLKHLLVWLDCATVLAGLVYVALSRVRRKVDLSTKQAIEVSQPKPVML